MSKFTEELDRRSAENYQQIATAAQSAAADLWSIAQAKAIEVAASGRRLYVGSFDVEEHYAQQVEERLREHIKAEGFVAHAHAAPCQKLRYLLQLHGPVGVSEKQTQRLTLYLWW